MLGLINFVIVEGLIGRMIEEGPRRINIDAGRKKETAGAGLICAIPGDVTVSSLNAVEMDGAGGTVASKAAVVAVATNGRDAGERE